jgi:hypothetical protein
MIFRYTDPDGDELSTGTTRRFGQPAISVRVHRPDIPLDRVEELIAGIRGTARQTAKEQQ